MALEIYLIGQVMDVQRAQNMKMRRLAMNEFTTMEWSFEQDVRNYAEAGYQGVGAVREKVQAYGIQRAKRLLEDIGLKVPEVCVAGWFVQADPKAFSQRVDDARQAIDMAAALEADALIVLSGPSGGLSFQDASDLLKRGFEHIIPHAENSGVRLALEAVHPMYRAGFSFISMLDEALDVCDTMDSPALGVFLDTYHLWWDNRIYEKISRAKGRIFGVHVNDFKQETKSLQDHGLPGEGIIPLRQLLGAIEETGFDGFYTIEVFCESHKREDYVDILRRAKKGFEDIWRDTNS